ncbi:LPS translocon maturation chaperone LptM [Agaribacter marinus]|nr:lipoprotein [Agaribacter marinus]
MRLKKRVTLIMIMLLVCACGQRGPLYLPEQAQTNQENPEPEQTSISENRLSENTKALQSNNTEDSP